MALVRLELAHAGTGGLALDGAGVGSKCCQNGTSLGGGVVLDLGRRDLELLCVAAGVDGSCF